MNYTFDPSTALRMAELHQADVRAAFPRRTRRPWHRDAAEPPTTTPPTARPGGVRIPTPRTPERESVSL